MELKLDIRESRKISFKKVKRITSSHLFCRGRILLKYSLRRFVVPGCKRSREGRHASVVSCRQVYAGLREKERDDRRVLVLYGDVEGRLPFGVFGVYVRAMFEECL